MTENEIKIANRADEIQKDMHNIYGNTKSKVEYQNYVIAFLINKIAALEIKLEELK